MFVSHLLGLMVFMLPGEGLGRPAADHPKFSCRQQQSVVLTLLCVLQYVPVDTIICFRASCPIVIAIIEFLYLGRELPSFRSWASLFGEILAHYLPDKLLTMDLLTASHILGIC